jgi:phosphoribosylformylglycinamidine cyclo-ligase
VLEAIINGTSELFDELKGYGVNIHYLGGETADVGDVVRTIAVNGTMTSRWPKNRLITNEKISPGDVIVGLSSFGKASYEHEYNSGIGSNGLTSARHDFFAAQYGEKYPESFDPALPSQVVYIGEHKLTDEVSIPGFSVNAGKLVLSPTRTFAPVIKNVLTTMFESIHGMIHCSGGGQTKCLKYLPSPMKVIKDNLFTPPPVFDLIEKSSGATPKEMFQVFNMGCRLEIYTDAEAADRIISMAEGFGIEARIIGRVEHSDQKNLDIHYKGEIYNFIT